MGRSNSKQNLLQGAAVLGASMIIVKLLGALFKIFVLNSMNGMGAAYFNTAYNFFSPIYSLAIAGLPTAIAKVVANFEVEHRYRDIKKTFRLSMSLFILIGIIGSSFMALFTGVYVDVIGMPDAYMATISVAPALFFLCITSALRGYYEGLRNMRPTAVSEVVEVIAKVALGIILTWATINVGRRQYSAAGVVFGVSAGSEAEAEAVIMPYAAAAAIWGVTLSCLAGMLYLVLRYKLKGDNITIKELKTSPRPTLWKKIVSNLIKIAIPISIGAFVLNLATLIDTFSVTNLMNNAFVGNFDKINSIFGDIIPSEHFNKDDFGTFLYGAYSYAFSIFNLIPAFTGVFGKSALPNVVNCWNNRDYSGTKRNVESTLRMSSMIAVPAGIGLCVLAEPVLNLLYSSNPVEVSVSASAMSVMGISVIFLGVLTPAFTILQALDKMYAPVKLMIIGSIIKVVINIVLISVPEINLQGAAYGTLGCYLFIVVVSIWIICKVLRRKINFTSVFVKPSFAGILCGISAVLVYNVCSSNINAKIATILAIAAAVAVYVFVLVIIKGISADDVTMLPKGKKIAKILEKYKLLG